MARKPKIPVSICLLTNRDRRLSFLRSRVQELGMSEAVKYVNGLGFGEVTEEEEKQVDQELTKWYR